MTAIETYSKLKCDLVASEEYLQMLKDKREELLQKYCGIHSPATDGDGSQKMLSSTNDSKVIAYMEQMDKLDENGLSLRMKIVFAEEDVRKLKQSIKAIEKSLKELKSKATRATRDKDTITYILFYNIVVLGMKPTRAVKLITDDFEFGDETAVWKTYYPKVRKLMHQISRTK